MKRLCGGLAAVVLLLGSAGQGPAEMIVFPVNVDVNESNVTIGTITANTADRTTNNMGQLRTDRFPGDTHFNTQMSAMFTLSADFLALCDWYNFHWVQVVTGLTDDPHNPQYQGQALRIPVIDPPNGGYDGLAHEDDKPWYWTAAEEAGQNAKTADGATFGISDWPSVKGTTFDTWLVAEPRDNPNDIFCVIAGFEWSTGDQGSAASLAAKNLNGGPTAADIMTINDALGNSGFEGWTALGDCNLNCPTVPEPASLTLAGLGAVSLIGYAWRRRKRPAA